MTLLLSTWPKSIRANFCPNCFKTIRIPLLLAKCFSLLLATLRRLIFRCFTDLALRIIGKCSSRQTHRYFGAVFLGDYTSLLLSGPCSKSSFSVGLIVSLKRLALPLLTFFRNGCKFSSLCSLRYFSFGFFAVWSMSTRKMSTARLHGSTRVAQIVLPAIYLHRRFEEFLLYQVHRAVF